VVKVKFIILFHVMDVRGKLLDQDSNVQSVLIMTCAVLVKVKVFMHIITCSESAILVHPPSPHNVHHGSCPGCMVGAWVQEEVGMVQDVVFVIVVVHSMEVVVEGVVQGSQEILVLNHPANLNQIALEKVHSSISLVKHSTPSWGLLVWMCIHMLETIQVSSADSS
jgi:hypothetical protein